jgi:hypothetical protein
MKVSVIKVRPLRHPLIMLAAAAAVLGLLTVGETWLWHLSKAMTSFETETLTMQFTAVPKEEETRR